MCFAVGRVMEKGHISKTMIGQELATLSDPIVHNIKLPLLRVYCLNPLSDTIDIDRPAIQVCFIGFGFVKNLKVGPH